jgi:hypothetical protein
LGEDNIRLISLLSSLLEQKWKEQQGHHKDVFTFVISWTPMVNYLHRFSEFVTVYNDD